MKEQTPITAWEFYENSDTANVYDVMEQYAQAKVLEALEREVPKAYEKGYNNRIEDELFEERNNVPNFNIILPKEYYETEVKPKYEK